MLARQTLHRVLNPEFKVLAPEWYKKKDTDHEGKPSVHANPQALIFKSLVEVSRHILLKKSLTLFLKF